MVGFDSNLSLSLIFKILHVTQYPQFTHIITDVTAPYHQVLVLHCILCAHSPTAGHLDARTLAYCECAMVEANAGISDQLMLFPFHTHPGERLWLPTSSCFKLRGPCILFPGVHGIHTTLASAQVSCSPHSNCHLCNDRSSSDFHRLNFSDDDRF